MVRDQRRLAAIVSADVAGYSRLMGHDESSTLAALKAHRRELIDPKIAEYGGRVVKTMGDGLLLEFPSVVDAVRCAVDVQRGMAQRSADVLPDQRMEFRIGINVGDIIIDGDDIYGDGVNVAARLETLAEPGGVCVSKAVRDQVVDKLSFAFEDLGAQQVKNIARPVEVYRIRDAPPQSATVEPRLVPDFGRLASPSRRRPHWSGLAGAAAAVIVIGIGAWYVFIHPKALATASGPPFMSVAVMPFTPASASANDERLAERITQDLTSAVERAMRDALLVSHGLVVAKYKDKPIDPRAVGHDLNVRYLVEGEVRDEGGAAVIAGQIVETTNGAQIWSDRVSGSAGSDWQGDIVAQLTSRLEQALYHAEEKRVSRLPMEGATAMELVLHADALRDQDPSSPKGRLARRKLYEEALHHDPASVPAMLGLAREIEPRVEDPRADQERLVKEMDDLSIRATRADRDDPRAWQVRTAALAWQQQWDGAFEANAEALRIDPYRPLTLFQRARLLFFTGRSDEALPVLDRAVALDPRNPGILRLLSTQCGAHLNLGHYDEAIAVCKKAVALGNDDDLAELVAAYAQKGDTAKAAEAKAALLKQKPDISIASGRAQSSLTQNPIFMQQQEAHLFTGLRKAGIPEQ